MSRRGPGESTPHRGARARPWRIDQVLVLLLVAAVSAAVAAALILAAPADTSQAGRTTSPLPVTPSASTTPTPTASPDQPENIDTLRAAIRTYYADPKGTGRIGRDSAYARSTAAVARAGTAWLAAQQKEPGKRVVVFDIDDTLLSTWSYTVASDWVSTSAGSRAWVLGQHGTPVPGMLALAKAAVHDGYTVIYLTGRGQNEQAATLGNLGHDGVGVDAGYPAPSRLSNGTSALFLRPSPAQYPAYLRSACASDPGGSCTTQHFKTAVREHLEALGYRIVASFGDQPSDLAGGHAQRTFRLPNPNYRTAG